MPGAGVLRLRSSQPGLQQSHVFLHDETPVGRHPNNHLCIARETVSRFHARVIREGGRYAVEDLGSSNGTFVNGHQVVRRVLRSGDKIQFGDLEYEFHQEHEDTSQSGDPGPLEVDAACEETHDEVLRIQPVEDAAAALTGETGAESAALASKYLKAHYDFLEMVRERPSEDRLLNSFLVLAAEVVQVDRGVIMLQDEPDRPPRIAASYVVDPQDGAAPVRISRTILERCLTERVGILSRDASHDARFRESESVIIQRVRSAICVPLVLKGNVAGVCYLDRTRQPRVFQESDLAFANHIGSQLILALENLRMTRERLQAEQMSVIGQTMAEVSHSLKNILGITQSGAEVMDRHLEGGRLDSAKRTWSMIREGMDRMHSLATAMLDYSKVQPHERIEVQINDIARNVYQNLLPGMKQNGVDLCLSVDPNLRVCWLDAAGFYDVLMNLCINARDAVAEKPNSRIEICTAPGSGRRVMALVRDNGVGIPAHLIECVFDPFFTTKGAKGNGMGLAMVKKFIRESAGSLEVDSEPGKGTEMRLYFPVSHQEDEVEHLTPMNGWVGKSETN